MMSKTLLDAPSLEILDLLSDDPAIWPISIDEVRKESLRRLQSIRPPGGVFARVRTSRSTNEYLLRAYGALRDSVRLDIASDPQVSAYQWIWYLRRLPKAIFQGELKTTYPYDSSLAGVVSGWAPSLSTSPPVAADGALAYPVTKPILKAVLRLCAWTLLLSEFHAALRWSSKGVLFTFLGDFPVPIADPTSAQRAAVRDYDSRVARGPMAFLGAMTTPLGGSAMVKQLAVLNPDTPRLFAIVPIEDTEMSIPIPGVPKNQRPQTLAGYVPFIVDTAGFVELTQSPEFANSIWPASVPPLLQLLALSGLMFVRRPNWLVNAMQRGYVLDRRSKVDEILTDALPQLTDRILAPAFPTISFSRTPAQFWAELSAIRGEDLPLASGPIVREAGAEMVCLDLWAATARLNRDLQITESGGARANVRAKRFEDAVQLVIDASPWSPSSKARELRKVLRLGGEALTDIDAVAEYGATLLLVSCKALFYTPQYDAGVYSAIRNAMTTVDAAITTLDRVLANPLGDNYTLTDFQVIQTAVCTPQPVFMPVGPATRKFRGLPRACSIDELRRWLEHPPKRATPRQRRRAKRR